MCTYNAGRSQMALGAFQHFATEYPKPWTDEVVQADVVITTGCGDACPVFPGKRYEQ